MNHLVWAVAGEEVLLVEQLVAKTQVLTVGVLMQGYLLQLLHLFPYEISLTSFPVSSIESVVPLYSLQALHYGLRTQCVVSVIYRVIFPRSLILLAQIRMNSESFHNLHIMNRAALLCLVILSLTVIADARQKQRRMQESGTPVVGQTQLWFTQVLDHFDYSKVGKDAYFSQRYFVIDNYFNPKVGPVFLFICGQYNCKGVPQARQWVVTMAQRLQGLILTLEHRFYGRSLPFGNQSLTVQNMRLLNSEQALKDLAYFTEQVTTKGLHGVKNNPWISIGGSYPGALSAWYRYKYPHLTIGAIASSAVINAIIDFKDFDEQMFLSANKSGQFCPKALNDSSTRVQATLQKGEGAQLKAQFPGADKLTDDEFLFYWVDSIVGEIQYGSRTTLCDSLKGKNADDQFKILSSVVKSNDVHEYGGYYLKDATYYAVNLDSSRAWMFQCCTEYGWWQTFSDVHPLRSKRVNVDFYRKFCIDSFGLQLWPDAERKNIEYGGLQLKATNLLMSNGQQDPWKWASLLLSKGNIISRVANCTNCAHCVDLYTPSSKDAPQLKKIRDEQYLTISDWIEEYWRGQKSINILSPFIRKNLLTE